MKQKVFSLVVITLVPFVFSSCAVLSNIDKSIMDGVERVSHKDKVTGERQVKVESESKEIKRVEEFTKSILAEYKKNNKKVDSENKEFNQVNKVFKDIVAVSHRQELPWKIHLLEDKRWNAFTPGGGSVFVYTGILEGSTGLKNNDELAAVLAHEIAHITASHSSERDKQKIAGLVDKKLKNDVYKASFSTVQENEADKYSVIYMALAGYNPESSVTIWKRIHDSYGSDSSSLLHTHPLNDERAKNLERYSIIAKKYYKKGVKNEDYIEILKENELFSYSDGWFHETKAGEGGGIIALGELLFNTLGEVASSKIEQKKRIEESQRQENLFQQQMLLTNLEVSESEDGDLAFFGLATNATNKTIKNITLELNYWDSGNLIKKENVLINWIKWKPKEKQEFGVAISQIKFLKITSKVKNITFE